jgi:hypothetical protein
MAIVSGHRRRLRANVRLRRDLEAFWLVRLSMRLHIRNPTRVLLLIYRLRAFTVVYAQLRRTALHGIS